MVSSLAICALLAAFGFAIGAFARFLKRRVPPLALASFLVLATLPFPRAFVTDRTPLPLDHVTLTSPWIPLGGSAHNSYLNDVVAQVLPWTRAVRLAWEQGAIPLRNRWNGCGMPLAANSQSAAFSPFTLATLPLSLLGAFLLWGAVKLGMAMAGAYLWVRELGASPRASYFAAVAFGLSLTFSQFLYFPNTAVFCLWPWILFLVECSRDRDVRFRSFVALTLVLAMAALAGHPESLALGTLFTGLLIVLRWLLRDLTDAGTLMGRFVGAGAVAAGATAFLLVPSLFAIRASNRLLHALQPFWTPFLSIVPHGPLWRGVLTAFFPYALGDLIHGPVLTGATGPIAEMDLGYFGIVGWSLALLVLRPGSARPRREWALLGLLACGLGVAVAQWPFAEVFALVPGIRSVFPLRFYSWVALAGPAVAALELDRFASDLAGRPRAAVAAAAIPVGLSAAAVLVFRHLSNEHAASGDLTFQRKELLLVLLVLLAVAVLLAGFRLRADLAAVGLSLLCAAELLLQWRSVYALYSPSLLYPETPMTRFLRTRSGPFRVAGEGMAMAPNTGVFVGLEDVRTHDPVERRDYVAFLDATCGFPPAEYFKQIGNPDASVFDFLNVRYMIATPDGHLPGPRWRAVYEGADGRVYENSAALPRVFVPDRVSLVAAPPALREPIDDANAAFGAAFSEIAANRDWRSRAWILGETDGEVPGGHADLAAYEESTNTISFRARVAEGPAIIVLSVVQDGGWTARDARGAKVDVRRANGPFLAVVLRPGNHDIRLQYVPAGFAGGAVVSVAVVTGLAVLVGRRALRLIRP